MTSTPKASSPYGMRTRNSTKQRVILAPSSTIKSVSGSLIYYEKNTTPRSDGRSNGTSPHRTTNRKLPPRNRKTSYRPCRHRGRRRQLLEKGTQPTHPQTMALGQILHHR